VPVLDVFEYWFADRKKDKLTKLLSGSRDLDLSFEA
jgi:hypothetical protein